MTNVTYPSFSSFNQHTLKDSFSCVGVGLHTGLRSIMSVLPADINTGYTFTRRDINNADPQISARWSNVISTHLSTTIGNNMGIRVSTVEHILAALRGSGVDNAHIILDAPEVPILDGSALQFVDMINQTGLKEQIAPRVAIVIEKTISVQDGEKFASLSPSREPQIDIEINFDHPAIGKQQLSFFTSRNTFNNEIAPARTFGFEEQVHVLKDLGYCKGGNIENAIVLNGKEILNDEGLRFPDEFVRHKALDVIGDLALSGAYIVGKYTGKSMGHQLNNDLIRELMLNDKSWSYHTLENAHENWDYITGNVMQQYDSKHHQVNFTP